jgi:imidazolonepropionase-like amidohydrolase
MVSMTAGHGDMFTPEAISQRRPTADGPDECRKLVRHWARAGVDGIKIATSGGVLSTGDKASWRNYTREEIETIVDEAHALGMLVAAHAHTEAGIQVALDTGCDSIEHGTFISTAQAAEAARRGVSIAPTMLINDAIASRRVPVSDEQAQKASDVIVQRDGLMRAAADIGADFVLGTDANGYHVAFGDEMDELRLMSSVIGYSAERTLQAATTRAALAIGRADDLGRLAPGFKADFVVLRGRPWENLDSLRVENIVAVVSRGRVVAGALPGQ